MWSVLPHHVQWSWWDRPGTSGECHHSSCRYGIRQGIQLLLERLYRHYGSHNWRFSNPVHSGSVHQVPHDSFCFGREQRVLRQGIVGGRNNERQVCNSEARLRNVYTGSSEWSYLEGKLSRPEKSANFLFNHLRKRCNSVSLWVLWWQVAGRHGHSMLENVEALVAVGRDCGSYSERFEPTLLEMASRISHRQRFLIANV
jgi:hypothetical protein